MQQGSFGAAGSCPRRLVLVCGWLTPDGDIERIDLNVVQRIPLERRAEFPAPQAPFVYAFDPIPRADLSSFHRRAKVMANLLMTQALPTSKLLSGSWPASLVLTLALSCKTRLLRKGFSFVAQRWWRLRAKRFSVAGFLWLV